MKFVERRSFSLTGSCARVPRLSFSGAVIHSSDCECASIILMLVSMEFTALCVLLFFPTPQPLLHPLSTPPSIYHCVCRMAKAHPDSSVSGLAAGITDAGGDAGLLAGKKRGRPPTAAAAGAEPDVLAGAEAGSAAPRSASASGKRGSSSSKKKASSASAVDTEAGSDLLAATGTKKRR
jgi:hypothetical protein